MEKKPQINCDKLLYIRRMHFNLSHHRLPAGTTAFYAAYSWKSRIKCFVSSNSAACATPCPLFGYWKYLPSDKKSWWLGCWGFF